MRTAVRHMVSLVLMLSILLSSIGIALTEQLCLMTVLKKAEMQAKAVGCCEKNAPNKANTDDCCTVEVSFAKLEPVSSLQKFNLQVPTFYKVEGKPINLPWIYAVASGTLAIHYTNSSPPLYGRQLLHSLQILIV